MTNAITTEMLYELMLDFKKEMQSFKVELNGLKNEQQGFKTELKGIKEELRLFKYEVTKRFDLVDMHLNINDKRFDAIENLQAQDHKVLTDLWENRKDMKLSLTHTLLTVTGVTSGVIAFVVAIITGKAMTFRN